MSAPPQFSSVLHILAERAEWNQLAQYLHTLQSSPDDSIQKILLSCEGPHAWTPLMLSCARAPPDIIQLLLGCCPDSVKVADRSGTYPLHFVCSWKVGAEEEHEMFELRKVLELLLEFGPEVLSMQNQWGQTPLHCIFDNDDMPSVETLKVLLGVPIGQDKSTSELSKDERGNKLKKYSLRALATQDTNSYLPLHLAAAKGASEEILQLLISVYPKAAMTATASGDLPIHLLQYHAEDLSRVNVDAPIIREGSWRGGSGIFRLKKSKSFDIITLNQVEALLQPLCLDSKLYAQKSTDKMEGKDDYHESSSDKSTNDSGSTESALVNPSVAINLAMRLPGSRNVNLPIHIAAEHGASYDILKSLCEQNPEGVATPQPISKSFLASSCSSLSVEERFKSPEIYPLESFEKGRATIESSQAKHILNCKVEGAKESPQERETLEKSRAILKSFEQRSDLLFSFFPDALPSIFRESKRNLLNPQKIPFRKDPKRLQRLETLIRAEAMNSSSHHFSITAKRVWLWLYRGVNSTEDGASGQYQGSVGRIVTGMPKEALLKLSYISHVANDIGADLEEDEDTLRDVPCLIQGKSIIHYAEARDANMTMNSMLILNENEERNFVHTICECLDAHDALAFSATCRRTMRAGVRLLPETKLKETGRNWNLPSRDELTGPGHTEFWQHLISKLMLMESTHTVFISYYLEVSGTGPSPLLENNGGGLLITSEDSSSAKKTEDKIEAKMQKRLTHSKVSSASGYEVQLYFKFKPGRSYSVRVYGPAGGGRVSVSNARLRQVLHCLDRNKRTPLQALLTSKPGYSHSPLSSQITTLVDERYGFTDITSSLLLHFALRNRVSTDVLEVLIASNPSLLLETDPKGRTPLHTVFLLSESEAPTLGTIKLLLGTPGENATKLKDRDYKVPLHLAAEMGASNAILELLVDAYPDGCYRQTRDGDIPVHLQVKSGKATTSSVEMLLRPIMDSETICSIGGSQGLQLPLHIAAEYNCSYEVLERLLSAYGAAASTLSRNPKTSERLYAIDIFESNRKTSAGVTPSKSIRSMNSNITPNSSRTLGEESLNKMCADAANFDIEQADFNLRSDLIFVHYPTTPILYRKDKNRIRRLRNLIRREASDCAEQRKKYGEVQMSTMAQLAWSFLCTFENSEDLNDHYADEVGNILKSLTIPTVKLLASVTNPFSTPPHMVLSECATTKCKNLISSRVLFVGRYVFDENNFVLHKSDASFVVRAKDFGAADAYKKLLSTFKQEELSDIDDLESVEGGSIVHALSFSDDTANFFIEFATKIGLDEDFARQEFDHLTSTSTEEEETGLYEKRDLSLDAFREFCSAHNVDRDGIRKVVIKFMKHRVQFLREKVTRARLNLSKSDWYVFPVIEDYDIERAEDDDIESVDDIIPRNSWVLSDSKDNFFALDRQEMNGFGYDFSSFKYALVLPGGDRDFNDMVVHDNLEVWEVRDVAFKVGKAIKALHSRSVVHGNLILSNIVKFGPHVALIDLDSATLSEKKEMASILSDKIAGISQKFASAVLPPEMIARIDLKNNLSDLRKCEKYWEQVRNDAIDLNLLNADDIHSMSKVLKTLSEEVQTFMKTSSAADIIRSSLKPRVENPTVRWRDKISRCLQGISIDDLPASLSNCPTLQDFKEVWKRLKQNSILWERIRPRFTSDRRYAYVVKYHDDSNRIIPEDAQLPYDTVASSKKIDVWGFGVLLFHLCSRTPLFHQTLDGDLHDANAYEKLHKWDENDAKHAVRSSIKNPLAKDLLLKILTREEERMESIDTVLDHPFFGPWSSQAAQKILQEHEEVLLKIEESFDLDISVESEDSPTTDKSYFQPEIPIGMPSPKPSPRFDKISMEKNCKIIFERSGAIKVPTGFIVLPYALKWNEGSRLYEAPSDSQTSQLVERIGKHLLDINTYTSKLSFWLRVKESLVDDGKGFKTKILTWIQRARSEDSAIIAKEIVSAMECDDRFVPICIEMLDEDMSISQARNFIRDPLKAAVMLVQERTRSLLECYGDQYMYLIDEHRGSPFMPTDCLSIAFESDNIYPIKLNEEEQELRNVLLPFIHIAVMTMTANDGLDGLARLLGITASQIPSSWKKCTLGLFHNQEASAKSSIIEFATLQRIMRKKRDDPDFDRTPQPQSIDSSLNQEVSEEGAELKSLEAFYQRHDSLGFYAGLHRQVESKDRKLVFWTSNGDDTSITEGQKRFPDDLSLGDDSLQIEIVEKKKMEKDFVELDKRLTMIKQETDEKIRRKKERKARKSSQQTLRPSKLPDTQVIPLSGLQTKSDRINSHSSSLDNNFPTSQGSRTYSNFVL